MNYYKIIFLITLQILSFNFVHSQGFRSFAQRDSTYIEPKNIDVSIFRFVNNGRNGFSSTVIPLTDKSVLPVSIAVPLGLAGISRYNNNYYDENTAVLLALSEITGTAFTFGLKNIIRRERPFVNLKNVFFDKYNSPTDRYSFPSGHTTMAFSMAAMLTLRYPDKPIVITGSFLYAGIIGYGRMYLGVHYPSDVLAGMLAGAGSAALIYSLRKEIIKGKNNLFRENNPDSSDKELPAPAILGLTVGVDLINQILQLVRPDGKVFVNSGNQFVSIFYNF
ncbi:MAG: phosphatase PAP2 family protein [Ignavibacteria bacterium]|nr:phosphatase PAP2 family protein [Ignavibacteria bacterium]